MRNVVTVDMDTMSTVIGVKRVGDDCPLSECCTIIPDYLPELAGCTFNRLTRVFTDDNGNEIYSF